METNRGRYGLTSAVGCIACGAVTMATHGTGFEWIAIFGLSIIFGMVCSIVVRENTTP